MTPGAGRQRDNVIADAYAASDEKTAYTSRIGSGSATVDDAYKEFNTAQVALGLGKTADHERYLARSRNWLNVWDDSLESDGFRGFVRGRTLDGKFSTTPADKGFNAYFYEATCWDFSFNVPHDVPALVEKTGGRPTFTRRLAHAFVRDNAGGENIYVQTTSINDRALDEPSIRHADIVAGGELRFVTGPEPSASRAHALRECGLHHQCRQAREVLMHQQHVCVPRRGADMRRWQERLPDDVDDARDRHLVEGGQRPVHGLHDGRGEQLLCAGADCSIARSASARAGSFSS